MKKSPHTNDFLSELVIWRNDPEQAEYVARLADEGHRDAQYALGLMYAEGRGVKQDGVEAYLWLSRAIAQGDRDAEVLREVVQQHMSFEQIRQAEHRLAGQTIH